MPIIKDINLNETGKEIIVYIDVDKISEHDHRKVRGPVEQVLTTTKDVFNSAMDLIHNCAVEVANTITKIEQAAAKKPAELEVQLAVKLDAEIGAAVLVKTSAEAQLQITIRWSQEDKA